MARASQSSFPPYLFHRTVRALELRAAVVEHRVAEGL